ncbi:DMT family transporter [Candidatus Pseudothioglobus sp. Uisw_050_01]|uniref:DMT family transporter n=1 Tax=Candidatus Pseudothioglobus sp. Uisw_050_01 TaxID=3230997 RepID=UPI003A84DC68
MFLGFSNQNKAYLFAGIAIFFWSTVATAFKLALEHLEPIQLVFYSTLFSVKVLFVITLIQGKIGLIKSFSKRALVQCAFLGLLNPCLYYIILFKGYDILPAQEAMVINFSWPIMIVILSIPILKQKIDIKSFLSIIVCYVGVVVIATKGDVFSMQFENSLGVVYILITTVIWSLFWLFNTKNSNDSVVSLFLIFLFSLPYILIITYFSDSFVIPSVKGVIGSVYIGLFEMGISVVLWQSALKISTTVSRVASLVFITPFLSLLILHFVLKDDILASTIIGVILICSGLILQKYFTRKSVEIS